METQCQVGLLERADRHQKARASHLKLGRHGGPISDLQCKPQKELFVVCCKELTYAVCLMSGTFSVVENSQE